MIAELSRTNYPEWIGRPLGPGAPRVITQADVDAFAQLTGDHQWIHVDVERAERGPFGSTLVPGLLLLSLVPQWLTELLSPLDSDSVLTVGYDSVRFLSPVKVPSTLAATATLRDTEERGDRLRSWWELDITSSDVSVARTTAVLQW